MTRTTEVEGHFLIFCHLAFEFMYDIRSLPSQLLTLKLHPHVAINMKKDFSTKKTLPHPAPSVLSLLPVPYICRNILKSVAITQFVHKRSGVWWLLPWSLQDTLLQPGLIITSALSCLCLGCSINGAGWRGFSY